MHTKRQRQSAYLMSTLLSLLQIEESLLQQYRIMFFTIPAILLPTVAALTEDHPALGLVLSIFGFSICLVSFAVLKDRGQNATYFRIQILAIENPSITPTTPYSTYKPLSLRSCSPLTDFKRWQYAEHCAILRAQQLDAYYQCFLGGEHKSARRRLFDEIIPTILMISFLIIAVVLTYEIATKSSSV